MKFNELYLLVENNVIKQQFFKPVQKILDKYLDNRKVEPIIRQWFHTQWLNWVFSAKSGVVFIDNPFTEGIYCNFISLKFGVSNDIINDMYDIIDYMNQLSDINLKKYSKKTYPEVIQDIIKWKKTINNKIGKFEINFLKEGKDFETFIIEPNGFKWVILKSQAAFIFEGNAMGHCLALIGTESQPDSEKKDSMVVYSLYDKKNLPHITIGSDNVRQEIWEIRGKQDAMPKDIYKPYIINLIKVLNYSIEPILQDYHNQQKFNLYT